eukprot:15328079-Ditylum_brightwellii.AAC.1
MGYDVGWDPVVLSDEDAKALPNFGKYEKETLKLKIGFYDHLCFHQCMAMSQNGSGFMADIDSYPLFVFLVVVVFGHGRRIRNAV